MNRLAANHRTKEWMESAAIIATGWFLPGGGYLLTRRYRQFCGVFAVVCGVFLSGLLLHGGSVWISSAELDGTDEFTALLARAGVFGKVLAGAPYLLTRVFYQAQTYTQGRLHEYGTTLLVCAGILNLLALADAWESRGEKQGGGNEECLISK
jgi:hypothetical protein